jgi:hypothetical protein
VAIFTAIATFLLAGTFLAGSTLAIGALAIGLGVATQIGLSYALKAIAGNKDAPSSASDNLGVQGQIMGGGDVPRCFPLGYSSTEGLLIYANFHSGNTSAPNCCMTWVIRVSDLPGPQLLALWVNGEKCTFKVPLSTDTKIGSDNFGIPVNEYIKARDPNNPSVTAPHLYCRYYDGTQTIADPFLVGRVSSTDRPWASTRVGTGVAYVILTALTNDTLWNGFPTFKFELSGVPLYDVSKDSTAGGSGTHRFATPSTWGGDGDDFPAVQAYNILKGFYYNGVWLYGLQNMTAARLPAANWIAQIAKCRATITGESGPEPTYRTGMQVNVNAQPVNVLKALMTGCQGKVSQVGGFYKCFLGAPDSSSFSFTDDDIVSTETQTFRPFFALADSVNGIQAKYPDPTQGWAYDTLPAYYRTDLEAKDGNRRLMASPSFDAVPYKAQGQRLQKSAIQEGQRARTHVLVLGPKYWPVEPGDIGSWTSVRNGYSAKLFRTDGAIDRANLDAGLALTEVDPTDFNWTHSTDFKSTVTGVTTIFRPDPQGIVAWFAAPWTLVDAGGTGRRPAIRLSWDGTTPSVDGVQYEVRLTVDSSDVTKGRTDQLAAGAVIVSQSLIPNTAYQVRGQYLPTYPRDMSWSAWLDVTTPDVRLGLPDFTVDVVTQVTAVMDALDLRLAEVEQRLATETSKIAAQQWINTQTVSSRLSAATDISAASILSVQTVSVAADLALATSINVLTASVVGNSASITVSASAIATLNGYAAAQYSVTLDVNGYGIGFNLLNGGGGISSATFTVAKFQVASPGVSGGAPVPIFTVANVSGSPKVALRGDMLVDGTITATMIAANTITAALIAANTITAGQIAANTITAAQIAAGTITATEIAAGAITAAKINAGAVSTTQLAVGGVDITNLIAGAATAEVITAHAAFGSSTNGQSFVTASMTVKAGQVYIEWMGGVLISSSVSASTGLAFYVDGSIVNPGWTWNVDSTFSVNQVMILKWYVTGLSNASHTFELRRTSVGAASMGLIQGFLRVQELRR